MRSILVIAETNKMARELCEAAREYADEVYLLYLTLGKLPAHVADFVLRIPDLPEAKQIRNMEESIEAFITSKNVGAVLFEQCAEADELVASLALRLGSALVVRVVEWDGDEMCKAKYCGDAAWRTMRIRSAVPFISFEPGTYHGTNVSGNNTLVDLMFQTHEGDAHRISRRDKDSVLGNLATARVVVGIGRGVFTKELLAECMRLAEILGAGVGCTLPLHDERGWFPRVAALGVSELMISPRVYISLGTSGRSQHIAGITARQILSVNYDEHAEIFRRSDHGIVARVEEILPAMIEAAQEVAARQV